MIAFARCHAHVLTLLALTLALALAAGGCSSYRSPRVVFTAVRVAERTPEATRLELDFEVANPNLESVELLELRYTVSVAGRPAYRGRRSAQMVLAAERRQVLSLPAIIPADVAAGAAGPASPRATWSIAGVLHYTTPGALADVLLDTGVRRPKVDFRHRGTVDEWVTSPATARVREEAVPRVP